MPRNILMSWEENQSRWTKMHKGVRYTVAAAVLGGNGKTDTTAKANEWWTAKRAEIDGQPVEQEPAPESPEAIVTAVEKFVGRPARTDVDFATAMIEMMVKYKDAPLPDEIRDAFLSKDRQSHLESSVKTMLGAELKPDRALKVHFSRWKAIQLAADKSPARKKMNITMLMYFVRFLGEDTSVDSINETTWSDYWHDLAKKVELDEGYRRRILAMARNFLEYLAEENVIPAPKNVNSKLLKFRNVPKRIKPKDTDTIRELLAKVKGQTRLHILLGLNCGMLPVDIASLKQDQVDWENGKITRPRTKLKHMPDAPTVTYLLWKETFDLLKEHRSTKDIVLVTKSGRPWLLNSLDVATEKYKNSNSIASGLRNARGELKVSPKDFRTTGASTLAEHPHFKFYALHYLADSPKGTANKNYVLPSQTEFDAAITWLRTKFMWSTPAIRSTATNSTPKERHAALMAKIMTVDWHSFRDALAAGTINHYTDKFDWLQKIKFDRPFDWPKFFSSNKDEPFETRLESLEIVMRRWGVTEADLPKWAKSFPA